MQVLGTLGLCISKHADNGCIKTDQQGIAHSKRKSSEEGKRKRKKLRALNKGFVDKEIAEEGRKSYSSDSF